MTNKNYKIKTEHDISKYYKELYQFLGHFAADADPDIFDEKYTIKRSYDNENKECCFPIIYQANEILAMKPFSHNAIETSTNLLISEVTDEKQKSEEIKEWLRHVIRLL